MTGALNALRQGAVKLLKECGLNAVLGMEPERASRWRETVIAVSLSKVVCAPGGFKDYLGMREDREGRQEELYGRAVELTLAMDIYAPRDGGEGVCQEVLDRLAETIMCQGLNGLNAIELQAGPMEFLDREGLYRRRVSCLFKAWLVAAVDGGGFFVDIEVRGRRI